MSLLKNEFNEYRLPTLIHKHAGVGQFLLQEDDTKLPAGGTWVYVLISTYHGGATEVTSVISDIAAGGTVINNGFGQPKLLCWRIQ